MVFHIFQKDHSKDDEDNKFIMYWDANNLYGWAMNQPLPYCDFNFLTKKKLMNSVWILLLKIVQ